MMDILNYLKEMTKHCNVVKKLKLGRILIITRRQVISYVPNLLEHHIVRGKMAADLKLFELGFF